MIRQNDETGDLLCDGCNRWFKDLRIVVMGDWLERVWSYVFCERCCTYMHNSYMTIKNRSIQTTMNVVVRGQNINVSEILILETTIDINNFVLYDLPDAAMQR